MEAVQVEFTFVVELGLVSTQARVAVATTVGATVSTSKLVEQAAVLEFVALSIVVITYE